MVERKLPPAREVTEEQERVGAGGAGSEPRWRESLSRSGLLIGLLLLIIFATLATKCHYGYRSPFGLFTFIDQCIQGDNVFLRPINLLNLTQQVTVNGILAVGMTLIILIGGIDLSVGSMLALTTVILALLIASYGAPAALVGVFLVGALVGLWNGSLITGLRLPSFIATLGMLNIARGLALVLSGAAAKFIGDPLITWMNRTSVPPDFSIALTALIVMGIFIALIRRKTQVHRPIQNLLPLSIFALGEGGLLLAAVSQQAMLIGSGLMVLLSAGLALALAGRSLRRWGWSDWIILPLLLAIGIGPILIFTGRDFLTFENAQGIPFIVFIFAILAIATDFALRRTRFGRFIYAIGGNPEAARRAGINVKAVTTIVFTLGGLYAAIAGLMLAVRLSAGVPAEGVAAELDAITAVVIGGTSLMGGIGTIRGSVIGAFIIGIISNSLSINGIDANWQLIIKGLVMIAAVALDQQAKRPRQ